jgi:hypothetical protein
MLEMKKGKKGINIKQTTFYLKLKKRKNGIKKN